MSVQSLVKRLWRRLQKEAIVIWNNNTGPRFVSVQTQSDASFLQLFALPDLSTLVASGDIAKARQTLLTHFGQRLSPGWPQPPEPLLDIRLALSLVSHTELIAQANDALANRFMLHDQEAPKVSHTGQIDWRFNPTPRQEWLWQLNRHQWWPLLGVAYRACGDERYASAFVDQMLDWVNCNPPVPKRDETSPTWRLMEVGMRLRASWIPAFALFYESPSFHDKAKLTMLRAIYDHAQFLALFYTNRNHLLRESNGLLCASLYLPEFRAAEQWKKIALTRIDQELTKQVNQDGSHIEVSTGYQCLVIDEFEDIYHVLKQHQLSLPNEDLASRLETMYQMLTYLIRPDGTFPEVNDGFLHWKSRHLTRAGRSFNRPDLCFVGSHGAEGCPPSKTSTAIPDAGFFVMRTDWTSEACYLFFDAGPFGGPHGHEDKLNIEVCAFGQPFIVDSGSYTYYAEDRFRAYFVGSAGHNTILVDGQSQIRRWQKSNLYPRTQPGNYFYWIQEADFDYVEATYQEGYGHYALRKPIDAQIIRDVQHTRRILFVKPDYWLILDYLCATQPHHYQLLFHLHPDLMATVVEANEVTVRAALDTSHLHIIPLTTASLTTRLVKGCQEPIQGWHSTEPQKKVANTTVCYEWSSQSSTTIATLLYPHIPKNAHHAIAATLLPVPTNNGLAFKVSTPVGEDFLMLATGPGLKSFGPYQTEHWLAGVRLDPSGQIVARFEGRRHAQT